MGHLILSEKISLYDSFENRIGKEIESFWGWYNMVLKRKMLAKLITELTPC